MKERNQDSEAMLRLQAGEDLALNDLMSRWQGPLVAVIYRYVGNEPDALDLAQETFLRVYESRRRYKPSGKFSAWIFTIASNLCRNHSRWKQRHPTVPLSSDEDREGEDGQKMASLAPTPAERAEREDRASAVKEAVGALPHDLKTAVILFEYQDMSYREIADVLGCSPKAVETRLYRARQILKEKLAALADESG